MRYPKFFKNAHESLCKVFLFGHSTGDFVSSHIGEHTLVILLEYNGWDRFSGWSAFFVLFEYSFLDKDQKRYDVGKL